jgi:hypothetical protein
MTDAKCLLSDELLNKVAELAREQKREPAGWSASPKKPGNTHRGLA